MSRMPSVGENPLMALVTGQRGAEYRAKVLFSTPSLDFPRDLWAWFRLSFPIFHTDKVAFLTFEEGCGWNSVTILTVNCVMFWKIMNVHLWNCKSKVPLKVLVVILGTVKGRRLNQKIPFYHHQQLQNPLTLEESFDLFSIPSASGFPTDSGSSQQDFENSFLC